MRQLDLSDLFRAGSSSLSLTEATDTGAGIDDAEDIQNGASIDCNLNGVPDECESDDDNDGIPDQCEIDQGTAEDCNGNGIIDSLDILMGVSEDSDGDIDTADLATLLGAWGVNPEGSADLNGDGLVNAADLALLLGAWGPCA